MPITTGIFVQNWNDNVPEPLVVAGNAALDDLGQSNLNGRRGHNTPDVCAIVKLRSGEQGMILPRDGAAIQRRLNDIVEVFVC